MGVECLGTTKQIAQFCMNICIRLRSAGFGTSFDSITPAFGSGYVDVDIGGGGRGNRGVWSVQED